MAECISTFNLRSAVLRPQYLFCHNFLYWIINWVMGLIMSTSSLGSSWSIVAMEACTVFHSYVFPVKLACMLW